MANQIPQIEKYIRGVIATNGFSFNRDAILIKSKEWMENFPVEFNSVLNMIEAEGRNIGYDEMDDSTPSVDNGCNADDSILSVTYDRSINQPNITNIIYGYKYSDDSTPSVAYYGGYADDSTPSVTYNDEYNGNIIPDHMSSVAESPMGSDHVDSSPGGYTDDFESCNPLQRTMSN